MRYTNFSDLTHEMNDALLIDFDGTLCHDRFWKSLDPELLEKVQQHLFSSNETIVNDWMNGIYTSEDVNKQLADALHIDYDFLWGVFVKDCQTMGIDGPVLKKLKELRQHYRLALITNNMDCFDRFTVPYLKLDEYFDVIVNSFNERVSKNENDGQLFREVIERVGSSPPKSVLMDNSEKSCQVFTALGGTSCLVTKERPVFYWLDDLMV